MQIQRRCVSAAEKPLTETHKPAPTCNKIPAVATATDVTIVDSSNKDASAAIITGHSVSSAQWTAPKVADDKLSVTLKAVETPMLTEVSLSVKSASVVTLTVFPTKTVGEQKIVEVRFEMILIA